MDVIWRPCGSCAVNCHESNLRVIDADGCRLWKPLGRTEGGPSAPVREATADLPPIKNEKTCTLRHSSRMRITGRKSARNTRTRSCDRHVPVQRRTPRPGWSSASANDRPAGPPPRRAGARVHGAPRLHPAGKFIFIDGRSGAQMYSETLREEALYNQNDNTPALSSYFELMDNIIPRFLSTLSTQRVRGSRVLIK